MVVYRVKRTMVIHLILGLKEYRLSYLTSFYLYCRVYMVVYRAKRTMVIHWILGLKE